MQCVTPAHSKSAVLNMADSEELPIEIYTSDMRGVNRQSGSMDSTNNSFQLVSTHEEVTCDSLAIWGIVGYRRLEKTS